MNTITFWLGSFALVLVTLVSSCSHEEINHALQVKLAQEEVPADAQALTSEMRERIQNSKTMTVDQKQQLLSLQAETSSKLVSARSESLKLRSLLIKDLTRNNYNEAEVDLIKSKLKTVEDERLATIFSAVDRVNQILGRESQEREQYARDLVFQEHGRN